MLQRKPVNRLGYNGINEIKEHPWLKYYPWKDLYEKKLDAPFMPKSLDNFDKRYCEGPDKIGNDTLERYQNYYKNEALADVFNNYSFDNILTVQPPKKESGKQRFHGSSNSNSNGNHNTYLNNINSNNTNQKKRINSSLSNLNNLSSKTPGNNPNNNAMSNKNSINSLLKNKMKITESLYLNNNVNNASGISNISKNTPLKNNRTKSLNMNLNNNFINTPHHLRNISNSNLNSNLISPNYANANKIENLSSNTPNKNRSLNNLNMMKTRTKNLSMNSSTNMNNLNIGKSINNNDGHISKSNNSANQMKISINNSSAMINMKQSGTPYKKSEKNEKLPFIEQKLIPARQSSGNISLPKKFINSPAIKNGINSANIMNINKNNPKSGNKYTTLSANSTSGTTISMNFLHKRSGSTNTFNNY